MSEATFTNTEPAVEHQVPSDTEQNEPEVPSTKIATEEEETKQVEDAAEEIVTTPKASSSKRRSIFNPFGKSRKEEQEETEVFAEAAENKKKTKGFGSFFIRSKPASKSNEDTGESEPVSTELPQIEKLQPIETVDVTDATCPSDENAETNEAERETAELAETEAEQVDTLLSTPTANKRQSFISKIFGKKKPEEILKPEEEEEAAEVTETLKVETPVDEVEEPHEEEGKPEEKEECRPSSPLGRLTELFSKKKKSKTPAIPDITETAPVEDQANDEVQESNHADAIPAVVTASA